MSQGSLYAEYTVPNQSVWDRYKGRQALKQKDFLWSLALRRPKKNIFYLCNWHVLKWP